MPMRRNAIFARSCSISPFPLSPFLPFSNPRLISLLNILHRRRDVAQSPAAAGYHPPLL